MMTIEEILQTDRESECLEFKREFVASSAGAWQELIKDIIAIANSGGGHILFGISDNGRPSLLSFSDLISADQSHVDEKIKKYVGRTFSGLHISLARKLDSEIAIMRIHAAEIPFVFVNPGTYLDGANQKTAFARGSLYFRHGPKSETAEAGDLRDAFERLFSARRETLYANIKRVVEAPPNSVFVPISESEDESALPVRITESPDAQAVSIANPDITHPYRQKELLKELNNIVSPLKVTSHHMLNIRRHYAIDSNPKFHFNSRFGSRQYSIAFLEWLVSKHREDATFFSRVHDLK